MIDKTTKWTNLPVEILLQIFQLACQHSSHNNARVFGLVCKAWIIPAQLVLYSTITIKTLSQLKRIINTLNRNHQYGKNVKAIELQISDHRSLPKNSRKAATEEIFDLFSSLLSTSLPNLEKIEDKTLSSYIPILNALLSSHLGQLKSLKYPSTSLKEGELANYATCALMMKDRLDKILISHEFQFYSEFNERIGYERLYFNRLYNNLHQFEQLTELNIKMNTNEGIQVLEYVVGSCNSLKKLTIDFGPSSYTDSLPQNSSISIDSISTFTPSLHIKHLDATTPIIGDYKTLLYIMHKFPQLQSFALHMSDYNSIRLDQSILGQVLKYRSGIDTFILNDLLIDDHDIVETIGNYWTSKPKRGNECLEIIYLDSVLDEENYMLDVLEEKSEKQSKVSFMYPMSRTNREHTDFIEKNGKHLKEFQFRIIADDSPRDFWCYLPENFLIHTLTHCTNLQILHVDSCIFELLAPSGIDLREKTSTINKLVLENCVISVNVFEELSLVFSKIKQLRLSKIMQPLFEDQPLEELVESTFDVIMPHTEIETIVFEQHFDDTLYIKVYSVSDDDYYYYQFDRTLEKSNEQEYTAAKDNERIYISCKTKPENILFEVPEENLT